MPVLNTSPLKSLNHKLKWKASSKMKLKPEVTKQSMAAAAWTLSQCIFRLGTISSSSSDSSFFINNLCEAAFSQTKIIESRYRSHLTDKHLKY